jgi:hypothetical protein
MVRRTSSVQEAARHISGTLTVTGGMHTGNIALLGQPSNHSSRSRKHI